MRRRRATSRISWALCLAFMSLSLVLFSLSKKRPHTPAHVTPHVIDLAALEDIANVSSPELVGFWTSPPRIKICQRVNVKKSRIERAVRFWERLGYEFGEVYFDDGEWGSPRGCIPHPGEIAFLVPPQGMSFQASDGSTYMALTRMQTVVGTYELISAEIFVQYTANYEKERMVEHEIGHALGWLHNDSSYHIMHSLYPRGGHRISGVHKSDYDVFSTLLIAQE